MSSTTITRKLLPAKRAWKKVATMFRSKLLCLKRSKAYKRTARGLDAAVSTMLGRRRHPHRFRLQKRPLSRPPSDRNRKSLHRHYHQQHGFLPVYVDDLFAKPTTPVHIQVVQPAVVAGKVLLDNKAASGTGMVAGESSKIIKARPPVGVAANQPGKNAPGEPSTSKTKVEPPTTVGIHQLEGVDLRAELFIAKFKEEMRLQRQRSFEKE